MIGKFLVTLLPRWNCTFSKNLICYKPTNNHPIHSLWAENENFVTQVGFSCGKMPENGHFCELLLIFCPRLCRGWSKSLEKLVPRWHGWFGPTNAVLWCPRIKKMTQTCCGGDMYKNQLFHPTIPDIFDIHIFFQAFS